MKTNRTIEPPKKRVLVLALLTALFLAGCKRPAFLEGELPTDGPPIATNQEAALRFVEKVTDAGQSGVQNRQVALTVTETEVTSFLNIGAQIAEGLRRFRTVETLGDLADIENIEQLEVEGLGSEALKRWQQLAKRREKENSLRLSDLRLRLMIREPQVRFKGNGHMVVRGYIQLFRWRLPVRFVVAPHAGDGRLVLDFVAGKLGPLSLPEGLFDLIGKGLSRIILAGQDYAEIQEITVSEETLTIRGRYDRETIGSDLCIVC